MKLTLCPKSIGWRGDDLARHLRQNGMVAEFADPDFVVMMFTPEIASQVKRVVDVLCAVERRTPLLDAPPVLERPVRRMAPREAVLSVQEPVAVEQAAGRVLAAASVNCPPAVPIVVCGEVIDQSAVECFRYYGIERVYVVRE